MTTTATPEATATIATSEAAEILGVSPGTVRRLARLGILPAARTTPMRGSPRRFRREDVEHVRDQALEGVAA